MPFRYDSLIYRDKTAGMNSLIVVPVGGNTNLGQTILGWEVTEFPSSYDISVPVNQLLDRVCFEIGIFKAVIAFK